MAGESMNTSRFRFVRTMQEHYGGESEQWDAAFAAALECVLAAVPNPSKPVPWDVLTDAVRQHKKTRRQRLPSEAWVQPVEEVPA